MPQKNIPIKCVKYNFVCPYFNCLACPFFKIGPGLFNSRKGATLQACVVFTLGTKKCPSIDNQVLLVLLTHKCPKLEIWPNIFLLLYYFSSNMI